MMVLFYIASCLALAAAFSWLSVISRTQIMLASLNGALAVMRDPAMDDDAKEKAIQRASVRLLGQTVTTSATLALAFGAAAIPAAIGAMTGAFTLDAFVVFSLRPVVLITTIAVFVAIAIMAKRFRRPAEG